MSLATANASKPTVAEDAIATADGYLNNAVLPTYSELLTALGALVASMANGPHARSFEVAKPLDAAAALLAQHDRTLSGNFKG